MTDVRRTIVIGFLGVAILAGSGIFVFGSPLDWTRDRPLPVTERLKETGRHDILAAALERTGLNDALETRSYTLLAPTDGAFNQLRIRPANLNVEAAADLIRNHIVQTPVTIEALTDTSSLHNVRGMKLTVRASPSRIEQAQLLDPDLPVKRGVVHTVDQVITEDTPTSRGARALPNP
jgi:uncharacterized surface protein with fasciclin (FAS1) repeats